MTKLSPHGNTAGQLVGPDLYQGGAKKGHINAPDHRSCEKKVFESVWNFLTGRFTRYRDLEKKCEDLKEKYELLQHELAEERRPRLAFEKLMSELECHHEDENIYWRKDGKGGPYCGVCLNHDQKLTPMTHAGEGAFYCCIHKQYFRTKECREREENRPQPKQPSYGEHGWLAR